MGKITDYCEDLTFILLRFHLNFSFFSIREVIPYVTDEQADAVTKNPQLKLLFRLCKFYILDDGECTYMAQRAEFIKRTCRC